MNALISTFFSWGETPLKRKSYALALGLYLAIYLPYATLLPGAIAWVGPLLCLPSILTYHYRLRSRTFFSALLIALSIFYTFQVFGTIFGLLPGVAFLSMLASLKLYELRSRRDLYLYLLVLVLLMVGLVVSVDSFYALVHIVGALFVIFWMLASYDEQSSRFKALGARKKIIALIFALSLPSTLILFILFPRLQWGNMLYNDNTNGSLTGFSDSLRPGSFSSIVRDNSAVFRVIYNSTQMPNLSGMYWRGAVLTRQNGFFWDHGSGARLIRRSESSSPLYDYSVTFEERGSGVIFTLEDTVSVTTQMRARLMSDVGGTYRLDTYSRTPLSYRAQTETSVSHVLSPREREAMVELGEGVGERLRDFVANFHPELPAKERINKFMRYIQKEKFSYTLSPGAYNQMDGLEDFFFDKKAGFCEHYASLTAVVLRLMKIPARVVVGFHGGIFNRFGNYYLVRGGDAHAWVEYWSDEKGWARIDPVQWIAPSRIELGATEYFELLENYEGGIRRFLASGTSGLLGEVLLGLDLVFFRLNQTFIAYDVDAQRDFLASLGLNDLSRLELTALALFACSLLGAPLLLFSRRRTGVRERSMIVYERIRAGLLKAGIEVKLSHGPESLSEVVATSHLSCAQELSQSLKKFALLKYGKSSEEHQTHREMLILLQQAYRVLAKSGLK